MDQELLKSLIGVEVKRITAPLEAEIAWLKAEIESLKPTSSLTAPGLVKTEPVRDPVLADLPQAVGLPPSATTQTPGSETASPAESVGGLAINVPQDRSDFARFLARGLEQEAKEYAEERAEEPKKKPGWNPFKR